MGEITATVFLTDIRGFVSSQLLSALLTTLSPSSVVWVLSKTPLSLEDPRIRVLNGSIEEPSVYREALLESATIFFDASGGASISALLQALEGGKKGKHLVVLGQPARGPQSELMAKEEKAITASSVPYTVIRPSSVYGRGMATKDAISHLVTLAYRKHWIFRLKISNQVSVIHVEDLVAVLIACIGSDRVKGKTFIAETEVISFGRIFVAIHEHITGRSLAQIPFPGLTWLPRSVKNFFPLLKNTGVADALFTPDESFRETFFKNKQPRLFSDAILGVIRDHVVNTGYWLVTGANSGIGYELACRLHAEGKPLLLVDKQIKRMAELKGNRIICADLSTVDGIQTVIETTREYPLFVLINNAGVGFKGDFDTMSEEQLALMMGVNMMAPVLLTRALLPTIARHGGTVVNIASSAGHHPLPGMGVYAATKAFILSWSSALWYEQKESCSVVTCSPSGTNTAFQERAGVRSSGPLLSPLEVADHILEAISKKKPFLFLGFKNRLVIAVTSFFPTKLRVKWWGELFARMR